MTFKGLDRILAVYKLIVCITIMGLLQSATVHASASTQGLINPCAEKLGDFSYSLPAALEYLSSRRLPILAVHIDSFSIPEQSIIYQILQNPTEAFEFYGEKLQNKIQYIFDTTFKPSERLSKLLELRRQTVVRLPGIAQTFSAMAVNTAFEMSNEDGLKEHVQFLEYDQDSGFVLVKTKRGNLWLQVGDAYGAMSHDEVMRLGFPRPEMWAQGLNQGVVNWKIKKRLQLKEGRGVVVHSKDPFRRASYTMDLRRVFKEFPIFSELGFSYDEQTGDATIVDANVMNAHRKNVEISIPEFEILYYRGTAPDLRFARLLVQNHMPIGVGRMEKHDLEDHLLERVALSQTHIWTLVREMLGFWLSVYDHPKLADARPLAEFYIHSLIFDFDSIPFYQYLFGLGETAISEEDEDAIDKETLNDFIKKIKDRSWNNSLKSQLKYIERELERTGGLYNFNSYKKGRVTVNTIQLRADQQNIFKSLVEKVSPDIRFDEDTLRRDLTSPSFLRLFTVKNHPERVKQEQ